MTLRYENNTIKCIDYLISLILRFRKITTIHWQNISQKKNNKKKQNKL